MKKAYNVSAFKKNNSVAYNEKTYSVKEVYRHYAFKFTYTIESLLIDPRTGMAEIHRNVPHRALKISL